MALFMLMSPMAAASDNCIFDSKLAVGEGITIEHSIRIEVVETSRDIINSAKFCISSYQLPARTTTLFEGDTIPYTYTTYSGTELALEVTAIYVDSVHFKVTGPTNWRVTEYYSVDPAEGEAETDAETATTGTPALEIVRSFDRSVVSSGQIIEVTFMIKNIGDGAATDVRLDESAIKGTYKEGCPSTIEDMAAGETRRVSYDIRVVDSEPGTYELSSAILNYKGESGDSYSTESTSNALEVLPETVRVPELEVSIEFSEPIESADGVIACGDRFPVTVRIANVGNATTGRVNVKSDLPNDVRVVSGESEPVFDSIEPGASEEYEITMIAYEPGKHTIDVVVMWADGETDVSLDFWAEESGLKEYYLQILVALPMMVALLGIIRRHRAYSY